MAAPNITNVYPAPDSLGIPIGDSIQVTFDQEMDESSINSGTLVVAAPANDVVFGPGLEPIEQQYSEDRDNILDTPYYGGFINGTIVFSRIDPSGNPVDDTEVDYDGDGTLWLTVATFTPDQPLRTGVEYTVIVAGDEDQNNDFDSGVRTRTVFDPKPIVVSGTGYPVMSGGYTGSATRTYVIEITGAGATGAATYEWWNKATPLEVYSGVTTTGYRELEDGVVVSFSPDGGFTIGDQWEVVAKPFESLEDNYSWGFSTGSGSIVTPPSTSSASGIESIGSSVDTGAGTSSFTVSDISPPEGEYGVSISEDPYTGDIITITLSDTLDLATVTEETVKVHSESPNGDESIATVTGDLEYDITASGTTITIEIETGQLYVNNIVVITLDKSIADTDGNTLGTEYISYFSTTYTPLYTGLRRIMLDIGSALPSDIEEETIYLAILIASLQADAISYTTTIANQKLFNLARTEYTTCLAERMLLIGSGLSSDRLSKTLGDLSVSRSGNSDSALKDELASCMAYWELPLQSGGAVAPDSSPGPKYSVKGATAEDAIAVGRLWEPTNVVSSYHRAAGNTYKARTARRNWKTYRTRYNRGGS